MVAALTGVFQQFAQFIGADAAALVRAQVRLVLTEPSIRRISFERRMNLEDAVWKVVQERGVSPQDLAARATVTTVISLIYLGLTEWASSNDDESLLAVVAAQPASGAAPVATSGWADGSAAASLTGSRPKTFLHSTARKRTVWSSNPPRGGGA